SSQDTAPPCSCTLSLPDALPISARAADYGQPLWIDIESSMYTERTIELFRSLAPRHRNLGLCLQAYLRRTATDLESLLPITSSIDRKSTRLNSSHVKISYAVFCL